MTQSFTLALAQMNPVVGDLAGNASRIRQLAAKAADLGADLVLYPEMALVGYPAQDLVIAPGFREAAMQAAEEIARATKDLPCDLLFGALWYENGHTYNVSLLASGGTLRVIRTKYDLPNYGVFDEKRVFAVGQVAGPLTIRGVRVGVPICEDIWHPDVCRHLADFGAGMFLCINGSPYEIEKDVLRIEGVAKRRAADTGLPLAYLNRIGGQDELVFDGGSFAMDAQGRLTHQWPSFVEVFDFIDIFICGRLATGLSHAPIPSRGYVRSLSRHRAPGRPGRWRRCSPRGKSPPASACQGRG